MADAVSAEVAQDIRLARAQEALTEALAEHRIRPDRAPPSLRQMLNADMPEWLALAAYAEMERQARVIRHDDDRIRHLEIWWRFVRSVAEQSGRGNGVRFPPDE